MSERSELLSYINDAFKDANGFRPRGSLWDYYTSLSIEELNAEADKLSEQISRQIIEEAERKAESVIRFEHRVTETISMGAKDRETAFKWIFDAEGFEKETLQFYGYSYVEHHFDLPYGYLNKEVKIPA